jgi:hypothetical protein
MRLFFVVGMLLTLASCAGSKPLTEKEPNLCPYLAADLTYVHHTISENYSGCHADADLLKHAQTVLEEDLKEAQQCCSNADYIRGIRKYFAALNDPHVKALFGTQDATHATLLEASTGKKIPAFPVTLQYSTTGLFLQRYSGRYYIKAIDASKIITPVEPGDELKSCDGKTPDEILSSEILPYESVSAREAAEYRFTPRIFVRWDKEPGSFTSCKFDHRGQTITAQLKWNAVADNYLEKQFLPSTETIYRLEKISAGHWVTLSSLAGYSESVDRQLKAFSEDAKKLRGDHVIVVDLRGNGGGNSFWGTTWIKNLFGYLPNDGEEDSVLVTPGNSAHYERFFQFLKKTDGIADARTEKVWASFLHTLRTGTTGQFAHLEDIDPPAPQGKNKSLFHGKIFVLTDYGVFSSGETFLEELLSMPRTQQVGIPSNASTYYSDIRFDYTPAGLPYMFPTKLQTKKVPARKSGEALTPAFPLELDPAMELKGEDSLRMQVEKLVSKTGST